MLILGGIAMLYSMGLGPIAMPLFRQTVNLGFRQMRIDFQI
jgi:hypothetical protein